MTSRRDYKRTRKAMLSGDEIETADVETVRNMLKSRLIYGRQSLVLDVVLTVVCVAGVISLPLIGYARASVLAWPVLGVILGLHSHWQRYRIRRWCDRHPEIAYNLFDTPQPEQHRL